MSDYRYNITGGNNTAASGVYIGYRRVYGDIGVTLPQDNDIVVTCDDKAIYISNMDITPTAVNNRQAIPQTGKINLLFYNNVATNGEVLSSLVYIGDLLSTDSKNVITYRPYTMFHNSDYEKKNITLPEDITNFSYFNYMRRLAIGRPSFLKKAETDFSVEGNLAPVYNNSIVLLDGWYTFVSAAVFSGIPDDHVIGVKRGQLIIRNPIYSTDSTSIFIALVDNPLQSNDMHWHRLPDIVTSGSVITSRGTLLGLYVDESLSEYPNSGVYTLFKTQDFFVAHNINRAYIKARKQFVEDKHNALSSFMQMKIKASTIDGVASVKNFIDAQLFATSLIYPVLEYIEL